MVVPPVASLTTAAARTLELTSTQLPEVLFCRWGFGKSKFEESASRIYVIYQILDIRVVLQKGNDHKMVVSSLVRGSAREKNEGNCFFQIGVWGSRQLAHKFSMLSSLARKLR